MPKRYAARALNASGGHVASTEATTTFVVPARSQTQVQHCLVVNSAYSRRISTRYVNYSATKCDLHGPARRCQSLDPRYLRLGETDAKADHEHRRLDRAQAGLWLKIRGVVLEIRLREMKQSLSMQKHGSQ